eukprot:CAMPEP_0184379318 /NCGR_PEP_ID=MMETSP0007-20130409/3750_1 /TAXON_ID=97485 /ORGANISM="Prymnesium parvum, Strain Texoma1" /LENGTH=48 /DNA_ID= /DNA_START= /DNA_END= /DNA_ORIENTATION=
MGGGATYSGKLRAKAASAPAAATAILRTPEISMNTRRVLDAPRKRDRG